MAINGLGALPTTRFDHETPNIPPRRHFPLNTTICSRSATATQLDSGSRHPACDDTFRSCEASVWLPLHCHGMKLQTCTSTGTPKTPKHITLQARRLAVLSGPIYTEAASISRQEHDALRCARTTTFAQFSSRLLPGCGNNILRNQTALRGPLTPASSVRNSRSGCNDRINAEHRKPPSFNPVQFPQSRRSSQKPGDAEIPQTTTDASNYGRMHAKAATSTAASAPQRRDASDTSPCELASRTPLQFN